MSRQAITLIWRLKPLIWRLKTELKTKTFVLETKIFVLETENLILRILHFFTNLYFKTSQFLVEHCVTLLGQYLVGQ